jgi:hypothetical protein
MKTNSEQAEALRDELSALDGTRFDGRPSIICLPFATPVRYLSGAPYLMTMFPENAYELGEATARRLIAASPAVLSGATILPSRPSSPPPTGH